jgi:hypothetical protein
LTDDFPKVSRSIWIPILGYYINYQKVPRDQRRFRFVATYTCLLALVVTIPFLEPFGSSIQIQVATYLTVLLIEVLGIVVILATLLETYWNTHTKNPHSRLFRALGWDRLAGKSRKHILFYFAFANLQEIVLGMLFCVLSFFIHARF